MTAAQAGKTAAQAGKTAAQAGKTAAQTGKTAAQAPPVVAGRPQQPADPGLLRRTRAALAADGLSQARAAQQIGISGAALNQWLAGKYRGQAAAVEAKVSRWLDARAERAATAAQLPAAPAYIETPASRRIAAALSWAQMAADLVVAYGGAGMGKTVSARAYAAGRPNVWTATMTPAAQSLGPCLERAAAACGLRPAFSRQVRAAQREADLLERLDGSRGLLIIDEAQHLSVRALEGLRGIHDAAGVGLALLGNEMLYARLTGGARSAEYAQLFSRIGRRVRLARASAGDVDALLAAWGLTDAGIRAAALDIARRPGALRGLTKTLRLAALLAAGSPRRAADDDAPAAKIELRHIAASAKDLTGRNAMSIADIAGLCRAYADARERLAETTEQIRALQRQALRTRLRGLRNRAAEVAAARAALREAVECNPQLFKRPRTPRPRRRQSRLPQAAPAASNATRPAPLPVSASCTPIARPTWCACGKTSTAPPSNDSTPRLWPRSASRSRRWTTKLSSLSPERISTGWSTPCSPTSTTRRRKRDRRAVPRRGRAPPPRVGRHPHRRPAASAWTTTPTAACCLPSPASVPPPISTRAAAPKCSTACAAAGIRPAPEPDKRRLIAKIRALLGSRPEAYAEAVLQRMTGHPHRAPLAWATPEQLRKVVAALNYDARRKRRRQ